MKTIVTTELIKKIADKNNIEMLDCYTGLNGLPVKSVCVKANRNISVVVKKATDSLPKISFAIKMPYRACCLIAEVAAWAKDNGKSLYQLLLDIYVEYGFSKEFTVNVVKLGKKGAERDQRDDGRTSVPILQKN